MGDTNEITVTVPHVQVLTKIFILRFCSFVSLKKTTRIEPLDHLFENYFVDVNPVINVNFSDINAFQLV